MGLRQSELHIAEADARPLKPRLKCVRVDAKPRLDGRLDDPVWQQARTAALVSAQHDDGQWPAAVMLAHDAEFLYLAIQCRNPPGNEKGEKGPSNNDFGIFRGEQPSPPAPLPKGEGSYSISTLLPKGEGSRARPRDADLSLHDRVEVLIDIDRDYTTYYRLAIDDRGWTNDRCWEDRSWNPTWYVASSRDGHGWTAEAAIPLKELTSQPLKPHETWAIGLQRVAPGVGFQSWNSPAAVEVLPDGFGLLEFE